MNSRLILISALSVAYVSTLVEISCGQALPAQPLPGVPGGSQIRGPARAVEPASAPGNQFGDQPLPEASGTGEIGRLVGELREADDSKKAELTKQLETAVAKQFERDMEYRQTELTKLDERLSKLRAQLDRRRKAKSDIIELQIKVLVNEAEGLGFGGQPLQPSGLPKATTRYGSLNYGLLNTPSSTPAPAIPPAAQLGR